MKKIDKIALIMKTAGVADDTIKNIIAEASKVTSKQSVITEEDAKTTLVDLLYGAPKTVKGKEVKRSGKIARYVTAINNAVAYLARAESESKITFTPDEKTALTKLSRLSGKTSILEIL